MLATTTQNVMIVDDDLDLLDTVRLMLSTKGFRNIQKLSSGTDALSALERSCPAVLVLDWVMPGLSGEELLQQIVQQYPELPVIVLTALNDVRTAVECMRLGAFDFLTKPVEPNRLISSINKAIQISELARQNKSLRESLLAEDTARSEQYGADPIFSGQ